MFGGVLLAAIEGLGIALTRWQANLSQQQEAQLQAQSLGQNEQPQVPAFLSRIPGFNRAAAAPQQSREERIAEYLQDPE